MACRKMSAVMWAVVSFGLASFAQAAISLTVSGHTAPDTIQIQPSGWIDLGLHLTDGQLLGGADMAIRLSSPSGHLDWQEITFINPVPTEVAPGHTVNRPWALAWEVVPSLSNSQNIWIAGGNTHLNSVGPYFLMQNLLFCHDEPVDMNIELVAIGTGVVVWDASGDPEFIYLDGTVIDSIYVSVPEPGTLLLLGLGGLALQIRKK